VKRRELLIGAAAWPLIGHAQEAGRIVRIGMAEPVSAELNAAYLAAFRQVLQGVTS
jgi:hypothetical protein